MVPTELPGGAIGTAANNIGGIHAVVPPRPFVRTTRPSARGAWAWGAAVAAAALFLVLGALVWHSAGPMRWERPLISAAKRVQPPAANTWQATFEPTLFALITGALALVALAQRRPKLAVGGTVGCFVSVALAEHLLKPFIDSRQPSEIWSWTGNEIHLGSLTFPSGHVTAAAACAMFAWFLFHRRTPFAALLFAIPVVVGWSMVGLGLHYPIDVVGGLVLGPLVVCACVALASRTFPGLRDARPVGRGQAGSS